MSDAKLGAIVEVKDVAVVYNPGKTNEAVALKDIQLEIYPEEFIIFFGPSGCGKSTLLNAIAGLENPSTGTVYVDRQDIWKFSADDLARFHCRKMGMVFQAYNLISTLNVLDNVLLPQIFEHIKPKERKERARDLLNKVGLEKFERRLPQELSGGQQQRIGIARALINNPPLILADEPVGNLDSESAKNVLNFLDQLNANDRKTIIMVTHNPEHLYMAHRIFFMKDGQIIKVEVNEKKIKESGLNTEVYAEGKESRTELDILLQSFPDLSGMQLHVMLAPFKAKMLAHYLISRFDKEEIERLEGIITDRLLDKISQEELVSKLDAPFEGGGMGLNRNTADKFSQVIAKVVEKADYLRDDQVLIKQGETDPIARQVATIRQTLMDEFEGNLTLDQVSALEKGIEFRILSKISKKEFKEFLDRPLEHGGVGLNKKTARHMADKVELLMLMEFEGT